MSTVRKEKSLLLVHFISADKNISVHERIGGACAEDKQTAQILKEAHLRLIVTARMFFGKGNNKVFMPKNKALFLRSKKCMI